MEKTPAPSPLADTFRQPLRTLVVDDSVVLLHGICDYLRRQPLFRVVGTAVDGGEALRMAEVLGPDLVLMDLRMPIMNGLQATATLRHCAPHIRIIIMTMDDSPQAVAAARAHGAHGFIWKPRILTNLIAEVRRVFRPDQPSGA